MLFTNTVAAVRGFHSINGCNSFAVTEGMLMKIALAPHQVRSIMPSNRHNLLPDRPEYRVTIRIQHLDLHGITGAHKRRLWRTVVDRLDHPDFGDAAVAEAAF